MAKIKYKAVNKKTQIVVDITKFDDENVYAHGRLDKTKIYSRPREEFEILKVIIENGKEVCEKIQNP